MANTVRIIIEANANQANSVIAALNKSLGSIGVQAFTQQANGFNKIADSMMRVLTASNQIVQIGYRMTIGLSAPLAAAGIFALKLGAQLEAARVSFEVLTGSIVTANAHLKELQQFALQAPYKFGDLLQLSRYLQAAGFEATKVVPLLKAVGNALAVTGSSESITNIINQLVHIQNLGRVTLRELNPLARAGIPVFAELAEAIRKPGEAAEQTAQRLKQLLKGGLLPSKEFIDFFQAAQAFRFPAGLDKYTQTLQGQFTIFENAVVEAAGKIGEALAPAALLAIKLFTDIAKAAGKFGDIINELPVGVRIFIGVFLTLLGILGPLIFAFGAFLRALQSLNTIAGILSGNIEINTAATRKATAASAAAATAKNAEAIAQKSLNNAVEASIAVNTVRSATQTSGFFTASKVAGNKFSFVEEAEKGAAAVGSVGTAALGTTGILRTFFAAATSGVAGVILKFTGWVGIIATVASALYEVYSFFKGSSAVSDSSIQQQADKAKADAKEAYETETKNFQLALDKNVAQQQYNELLTFSLETQRRTREEVIEAQGKELGGIALINAELQKRIDKDTTRIKELAGTTVTQEIKFSLDPISKLNVYQTYLAQVKQEALKTQDEIFQQAFKLDEEIYKNRITLLDDYSKAAISRLETLNKGELLATTDLAKQRLDIETQTLDKRKALDIQNVQLTATQQRRTLEELLEKSASKATTDNIEKSARALSTAGTKPLNEERYKALIKEQTDFRLQHEIQLQQELYIVDSNAKEKIKALDEKTLAENYQNNLKYVEQINALYKQANDQYIAATHATALKALEFQKEAIDARKQAELQSLEFIVPTSLQQEQALVSRKLDINKAGLTQNRDVEVQSFLTQAAETRRLREQELVNTYGRSEITSKALIQLDESTYAQLRQIYSKYYDDLGSTERQAQLEQLQIIRENALETYSTIKKSTDSLLDQLLTRTKSFGQVLGNALKSALLGVVKTIASAEISGAITKLLTGEQVQYKTSQPGNTIGNALSRLGYGKPIITNTAIPNQTGGLTPDQQAQLVQSTMAAYLGSIENPPKQLPIPPNPIVARVAPETQLSETLDDLKKTFGDTFGKIQILNGSMSVVESKMSAEAALYAKDQRDYLAKLESLAENDETQLLLKQIRDKLPNPSPSVADLGIHVTPLNPLGSTSSGLKLNTSGIAVQSLDTSSPVIQGIEQAIIQQERGDVAYSHNNPGAFRSYPGVLSQGGYAQFDTVDQGLQALDKQTKLNIARGLTLREFFGGKPGVYGGYAPTGDGNNDPNKYAEIVAKKVGISPDVPIRNTIVNTQSTTLVGNIYSDKITSTVPDTGLPAISVTKAPEEFKSAFPDNVIPESVKNAYNQYFGPIAQSRYTRTPIYSHGDTNSLNRGAYDINSKVINVYETPGTDEYKATVLHESAHAYIEGNKLNSQDIDKYLPFATQALAEAALKLNYGKAYVTPDQRAKEVVPRLISGEGFTLGLTQQQSTESIVSLISGLRASDNEQYKLLADKLEQMYSSSGSQVKYQTPYYTGLGLPSSPIDTLLGGGSGILKSAVPNATVSNILTDRLPESLGPQLSSDSLSVTFASDQFTARTGGASGVSGAIGGGTPTPAIVGPSGTIAIPGTAASSSISTNGIFGAPKPSDNQTLPGVIGSQYFNPQTSPTGESSATLSFPQFGSFNAPSGVSGPGNIGPQGPSTTFNPASLIPGLAAGTFGGIASGAIVGAAAGLAGHFTEANRVKEAVQRTYGVTLDNSTAQVLTDKINSQYGGNIQYALRNQDIQSQVYADAQSTGQKIRPGGGVDVSVAAANAFKSAGVPVAAAALPLLKSFFSGGQPQSQSQSQAQVALPQFGSQQGQAPVQYINGVPYVTPGPGAGSLPFETGINTPSQVLGVFGSNGQNISPLGSVSPTYATGGSTYYSGSSPSIQQTSGGYGNIYQNPDGTVSTVPQDTSTLSLPGVIGGSYAAGQGDFGTPQVVGTYGKAGYSYGGQTVLGGQVQQPQQNSLLRQIFSGGTNRSFLGGLQQIFKPAGSTTIGNVPPDIGTVPDTGIIGAVPGDFGISQNPLEGTITNPISGLPETPPGLPDGSLPDIPGITDNSNVMLPSPVNTGTIGEVSGPSGFGALSNPAIGALAGAAGLGLLQSAFSAKAGTSGASAVTASLGGAGVGFAAYQKLFPNVNPLVGAGVGAGAGLYAKGIQTGGVEGGLEDVGGATLTGASIGFQFGGPLGAGIGAAIGAGVGAITAVISAFDPTGPEKVQNQAKSLFGLNIDRKFATSIYTTIIQPQFGGNVAVGMRSQQVLQMLSLYAASTNQKFGIANQVRSAQLIQTGTGLTQQAIIENNKALSFANLGVYGGVQTQTILPPERTNLGTNASFQQLPGVGDSTIFSLAPGANPENALPGPAPGSSLFGSGNNSTPHVTAIINNSLPENAVGDYLDGKTVNTIQNSPTQVADAANASYQNNVGRTQAKTTLLAPTQLLT